MFPWRTGRPCGLALVVFSGFLFHLPNFVLANYNYETYEGPLQKRQDAVDAVNLPCGSEVQVQAGQKYLFDSQAAITFETSLYAAENAETYNYYGGDSNRRKRSATITNEQSNKEVKVKINVGEGAVRQGSTISSNSHQSQIQNQNQQSQFQSQQKNQNQGSQSQHRNQVNQAQRFQQRNNQQAHMTNQEQGNANIRHQGATANHQGQHKKARVQIQGRGYGGSRGSSPGNYGQGESVHGESHYSHGGGSYNAGSGGSYGYGYPAKPAVCEWTFFAGDDCSLESHIIKFKPGVMDCYKQQFIISDNYTDFKMCGHQKLYPGFRSETPVLYIKYWKQPYTYRHVFKGYVTCVGRPQRPGFGYTDEEKTVYEAQEETSSNSNSHSDSKAESESEVQEEEKTVHEHITALEQHSSHQKTNLASSTSQLIEKLGLTKMSSKQEEKVSVEEEISGQPSETEIHVHVQEEFESAPESESIQIHTSVKVEEHTKQTELDQETDSESSTSESHSQKVQVHHDSSSSHSHLDKSVKSVSHVENDHGQEAHEHTSNLEQESSHQETKSDTSSSSSSKLIEKLELTEMSSNQEENVALKEKTEGEPTETDIIRVVEESSSPTSESHQMFTAEQVNEMLKQMLAKQAGMSHATVSESHASESHSQKEHGQVVHEKVDDSHTSQSHQLHNQGMNTDENIAGLSHHSIQKHVHSHSAIETEEEKPDYPGTDVKTEVKQASEAEETKKETSTVSGTPTKFKSARELLGEVALPKNKGVVEVENSQIESPAMLDDTEVEVDFKEEYVTKNKKQERVQERIVQDGHKSHKHQSNAHEESPHLIAKAHSVNDRFSIQVAARNDGDNEYTSAARPIPTAPQEKVPPPVYNPVANTLPTMPVPQYPPSPSQKYPTNTMPSHGVPLQFPPSPAEYATLLQYLPSQEYTPTPHYPIPGQYPPSMTYASTAQYPMPMQYLPEQTGPSQLKTSTEFTPSSPYSISSQYLPPTEYAPSIQYPPPVKYTPIPEQTGPSQYPTSSEYVPSSQFSTPLQYPTSTEYTPATQYPFPPQYPLVPEHRTLSQYPASPEVTFTHQYPFPTQYHYPLPEYPQYTPSPPEYSVPLEYSQLQMQRDTDLYYESSSTEPNLTEQKFEKLVVTSPVDPNIHYLVNCELPYLFPCYPIKSLTNAPLPPSLQGPVKETSEMYPS